MSTLQIIENAFYADLAPNWQVWTRPSDQAIVFSDGEVRPIGKPYLFLRVLACPVGFRRWTIGARDNGDKTSTAVVTYGNVAEFGIDGLTGTHEFELSFDSTFGQTPCALSWNGVSVVCAIQTSGTTWRRVTLNPYTAAIVSDITQTMAPTSQGFMWFRAAIDPADDVVGWTDKYRGPEPIGGGVSVLMPQWVGQLTVGQPVVDGIVPQVTGSIPGKATSLFVGLAVERWPYDTQNSDGSYTVVTSVAGYKVAIWTGTASELPPYDPTVPVVIPAIPPLTHPVSVCPFVQAGDNDGCYGAIGIRLVPEGDAQ